MKYYLTIMLIFALAVQSFAWDAKVISKSGKAFHKSNNAWNEIKVGTTLSLADSIKTNESSIDLLFKAGGVSRIDGTRTVRVENIKPRQTKGVTNKFADYLMSEISESESLLNKDKKNMHTTGSVTRDFEELAPLKIKLHAPLKIFFKDDNVNFMWSDLDSTQGQYEIIVTNKFGHLKFSRVTTDKKIKFDIDDELLDSDEYYFIKIKKGKFQSNQTCFMSLSEDKYDIIADTLSLINDQDLESSLKYLIIASYFEHHNLILEAKNSFEELIDKYNEEYYIELYKRFLDRNNLIRIGI